MASHLLLSSRSRPTRRSLPLSVRAIFFLFIALALPSCEQADIVIDTFREPPASAHEAYLRSLEDAGLHDTALGVDWRAAAALALRDGPRVEIPYREEGFFLQREPEALGYRFHARRGELIEIHLGLDAGTEARVFTDLYRGGISEEIAEQPVDLSEVLTLIASASSETSERMEYSVRRTGEYTLRVQPELLRGGRYEITISSGPSLAFPVQELSTSAIQSFFGASREGGRREHHGVDIFAARGTPALAAIAGRVRVGTNNLGGNIIWLRDEVGNQNLYYAHLDSQVVRHGQQVQPGDTLGLVGNSGNARTTPPHLHFGIYARGAGPVDPLPFLRERTAAPPAVTADPARYGQWARVTVDGGHLRAWPGADADILDDLDQHTPLRVVAGSGDWFRVRLPDGRNGYIAARLTEALEQPLHREAMTGDRPLQTIPDPLAPALAVLQNGSDVGVLGRFGSFLLVQPDDGPTGWVANDEID